MAYFHLLAAWSNQDIEKVKKIISPDIKAKFLKDNCDEIVMDYNELIGLFQQRFESEQEWNFEVIYNAEKRICNIVVLQITRENSDHELIEDKALCTLFFKKDMQENNLIRLDMIMGIKDNK
ncbi:hypothetical protein ACMGE9_10835 [Macrococcus sp. EM39E]|uniref:hypothetical protein n=1 Tax=Macrococcus animalis TaxID=3395467 RepID=UPI0039BE0A43